MSDTGQTGVFEFSIVPTESTNWVDMHPSAFRAGQAPSELHVLVVDDNPSNLADACELLSRWGITPIVATDGAEAVAVARECELDLILMDLQMPVLDGLQASREICRRWPLGERPWIIAMTANVSTKDREECTGAGMDDFISKPVQLPHLKKALLASPKRTLPATGNTRSPHVALGL
jgi:CheY-like chemotaxis protein